MEAVYLATFGITEHAEHAQVNSGKVDYVGGMDC